MSINKKGERKMFVGDYIGASYQNWKNGESVFINAPTGTGKTTFVLTQLMQKAQEEGKEVLFLSNRYLLKEQIKMKIAQKQNLPTEDLTWIESIEEFDGITIANYQKIQELVENGNDSKYHDTLRYKYVVFDEIHYIVEDSTFNPKVQFLLDFIAKVNSIKVFMSATIEEAEEYLVDTGLLGDIFYNSRVIENEFISYDLLKTYTYGTMGMNHYVWYYEIPEKKRNIRTYYFEDYNQIVNQINQSQDKWLVFVSNKDGAKKWVNEIKVPFEIIHSDRKEVEVVKQIVQDEQFRTQVLVTTKLLDNGVNFHDSQLKHVVIDTISKTEFLQMLGRKRLESGEEVRLYIPKKNVRYFSGYYSLGIKKMLDLMRENLNLVKKMLESVEVYETVRKFYVYRNGQLKRNEAGKYKLEKIAEFLIEMCEKMKSDDWAFVKEQLSWINMDETFSEENDLRKFDEAQVFSEIQVLLKNVEGKWLDKEQQDVFRKQVGEFLHDLNYEMKNSRVPGKKIIGEFLKQNFPEYDILAKKSSKKGEKTCWQIRRIENGVVG